ncbi:serine/threonine protein kinase [Mycoplasmoides fastidiosum]|uniref:Serine/threonine protein kinase n=1 Tax=Mycoplasmoides fastidiosum TaxID=92758 RepID=A0ABU0LZY3_9BACT|nr:serine/threonine-protein kinase [Mycoplasmoides fastidiosum]MDQ0514267.1 serine/threonine protein kinase [Mycoplasmoides fastidiosum]UUD37325.1 serine/threonine protein kinase [Mycoplasmoides fastidiosum]
MKKEFKPGEIIDEKYELTEIIGEGGMNSVIWKAKQLTITNPYEVEFKNYCAIKMIDPDPKNQLEQFTNINKEINATQRANFRSDAFCEFYDHFWINSKRNPNKAYFAIVMELVDGMVLTNYIKLKGMIPVVEAMEIYEKILLGIKSLHQSNSEGTEVILHRDLKLDNVMLTSDFSRIKIIDLGIATVLDNTGLRSLKIEEKSIYGSTGYVPPEVKKLSSRMNSTEKAKIINEFWDIFAAGVILYNLIAAEFPYNLSSSGKYDVYLKPKFFDFPPLSNFVPNISGIIENIVYKSLVSRDEEIHHRYQNVDQILADVREWKQNPTKQVALIKPAENRNLEKVENFLLKRASYEVSSLVWNRSVFSYFLVVLILVITSLLIVFA